jgi:hypothetical protein
MLAGQVAARRMAPREAARWLAWRWRPGAGTMPAVASLRDPLPSFFDVAEFAVRFATNPGYVGTFTSE